MNSGVKAIPGPTGRGIISVNGERAHMEHGWYAGEIPANVAVGKHLFVETAHGFVIFPTERDPGLILSGGCRAYDRTTFRVGRGGTDCGRPLDLPQ
jgi:hypothetical protein